MSDPEAPTALTRPKLLRPSTAAMQPFESESVVLEGDPVREVLPFFTGGSADNTFIGALWSTTPCTLRLQSPLDSVIYVIEGTAEVDFEDGTHWDVEPGDVLALPQGAWATWRFPTDFKELVAYGA